MAAKLDETVTRVAQVMHEAVRAWQKANGQPASPPWSKAPIWMKTSSREAVIWRLSNPKASAAIHHEQWISHKKSEGWKYGRAKSGVKKTHPLMIPYSDLPEVERRKDALVSAVIDSLTSAIK
ncbi:MAG: RyR domain-containing protein [Alphaproteobacteria bacterium]